ncbi:hypothetical protein EB796_019031 [Bugula neritina]|uniref:Uncharacterized protein n=1 Tax=Bugula neritina TaxID=10212 RepID=A0A7J7JBA7_BUGNE|nr:hypothetical protein EB796_019031 [Bugula neritina]
MKSFKECLFLICLVLCLSQSKARKLRQPSLMNVTSVSREPHSITLTWNLSDPDNVIERWQVTTVDLDYEFIASYEGEANIDLVERIAKVNVHMPDTRYNICLIAYFNSSAVQQLRAGSTRSCDVYRSIPLLLKSSLVPLLVVVGVFTVLVLLGAISYKVKELSVQSHLYAKAESDSPDPSQNGIDKNTTLPSNHIEM